MTNPYETDELLNQYLGFHFGEDYFGVANYPAVCADMCLQFMGTRPRRRALDLGCAVGRSTFELARGFDYVAGVDLSARFIEAAQRMRNGEALDYFLHEEGELGRKIRAEIAGMDCAKQAARTEFFVDDACNLDARHVNYDLVFAGNLIDRVNSPANFLKALEHRVVSGGLLVISSPYTLLTEYTPRENWVGGYLENGQARTVLQGMQDVLGSGFKLIETPVNVPFVIRETARKFQHSLAQMTVWERLPA
jgi:putative 4-mercaptohistidine N1-methyltranferase